MANEYTYENHAFQGLNTSLRDLHQQLLFMGRSIQELLSMLSGALGASDSQFAAAKEIDREINRAETAIDQSVEQIVAKYNPLGKDLHFLVAAIKIASILERAADMTKNCFKRLAKVQEPLPQEILGSMRQLIEVTSAMVGDSLELITRHSTEAESRILASEAEAEIHYKAITAWIVRHGDVTAERTQLLHLTKNLERVADIAVDIMKVCHFIHTGQRYSKPNDAA